MLDEDDFDQNFGTEVSFGRWLQAEMARQNVSIQDLADKTGITYVGIWNVVRGNTKWPREAKRDKISKALNLQMPAEFQAEITDPSSVSGYTWTDFSPYDLRTIPELAGVYVFYDITDRPVYVGKSNSSLRIRVQDHQTRFWFKQPLVMRGSFLSIPDREMCDRIEMILIKFLGAHALLNSKGVRRNSQD